MVDIVFNSIVGTFALCILDDMYLSFKEGSSRIPLGFGVSDENVEQPSIKLMMFISIWSGIYLIALLA